MINILLASLSRYNTIGVTFASITPLSLTSIFEVVTICPKNTHATFRRHLRNIIWYVTSLALHHILLPPSLCHAQVIYHWIDNSAYTMLGNSGRSLAVIAVNRKISLLPYSPIQYFELSQTAGLVKVPILSWTISQFKPLCGESVEDQCSKW